ncbi:MAG: hypothetical protein ABSA93_13350 [Streptosporangiaceae bacterium]
MNVDEMDLVSQLKEADRLRPEAYERARAALRGAMAESGAPVPLRDSGLPRAGNRRRGRLGTRGKAGIGAGIGVVAAAAAAVLVATSAPQPAVPVARSASQAPATGSKLVSLAASISASDGSQPGNASLEIVKQTIGDKLMQVYYGLYTDSGELYAGSDKQTLMTAIAQHANLSDGADSLEVAAARYAATGDLATARVRMVDATPNDFFLSLAARKKIWAEGAAARQALMREKGMKTPLTMPTGQALQDQINNSLWTNGTDALNWAGGDPEVRAGVLRLLSTIPEVTVANSTTDGQPTLTITAGPAVFGGEGDEVLTVNATTGLPVSTVSTTPGVATAVETYQVSRVTLANIEAGKF